jgi:hypothetical protein
VNTVNTFSLPARRFSGKVKPECRPRAVLEAARLLPVALPAQLSLDLNGSPTKIQLGLHLNFYRASIFEQPKVVFFIPKVIRQKISLSAANGERD